MVSSKNVVSEIENLYPYQATELVDGFKVTMIRLLLVIFILSSIWTDTLGTLGQGIMGRLVPSDLFGAMAIALFVITTRPIRYTKLVHSYLFFLFALVPGLLVTFNPMSTVVELLILIFLGLIFVVMTVQFATPEGLIFLIFAFALASFLAAFIGIWNVFSSITGIPIIPVMNTRSGILGIGTFRNSGQAGAYMLISLSILIPAKASTLYRKFSYYQKKVVSYAIPMCIVFLILSIKRASIIGFLVGITLWVLIKTSKGVLKIGRLKISSLVYVVILFVLVFSIISSTIRYNQEWLIWWQFKVVGGLPTAFDEESFIKENLSDAILAFEDNPFLGSGMGGFAGRYMKYEIHSTYFKMLGEAGLLGVIGYLVFMITSSKYIISGTRYKNQYSSFLRNSIPFLIGCFVSWAYTYHLRKREFWIMFAILFIAASLSRKLKTSPTVN